MRLKPCNDTISSGTHTILDDLDRVTVRVPLVSYDYCRVSVTVRYVVSVEGAAGVWRVARRYSEFAKLHRGLFGVLGARRMGLRFPNKARFYKVTNESKGMVENRREALEEYLTQLVGVAKGDKEIAVGLEDFLRGGKAQKSDTVTTLWVALYKTRGNIVCSLPWASYTYDETGHYYEIEEAKGEQLDIMEARKGEFSEFCKWICSANDKVPSRVEAQNFLTEFRFSDKYGAHVSVPSPPKKPRYIKPTASCPPTPPSERLSTNSIFSISITPTSGENYRPLSYDFPLPSAGVSINSTEGDGSEPPQPPAKHLSSPKLFARTSASPDNIFAARATY
eukprot:TRINITY_DN25422_c0_g1_i2.p1 TRINITY_DN25422_c0_g1~~TRINITY_DN25422_c0_g1_i2.p1  ORF type:complete len:336 (+),score=51.95 TRINITY_DN25422_c0_g1_i2:40-1047(+)